ncbi:MAG: amidohydrolase family protein [Armatimonadota bacterium]|jgi:predicted TIM-barrel fold metal-dependent hydrolase
MIIDAHAHISRWEDLGYPGDAETCLRAMDRYEIDVACVSNSRSLRGDFVRGNRVVAEALRRWPDRFRGWAVAHPLHRDLSLREIRACITELGFIGCKFHISHTAIAYADPRYDPLFDLVRELQVPVLFHAFDGGAGVAEAADRHPDVTMIAGHMGGYRWDEGALTAVSRPNIYLELCCSCPERGIVEMAVECAGEDRVLFGTDLPMLSPATTLGKVHDADLTDDVKRKILAGNMARLLGMEAAQ